MRKMHFISFCFKIKTKKPNAETRAALEEVALMKLDPSLGKSYTDADQMIREILA